MGERRSNRPAGTPSVGISKGTTISFFLVATFALMALLSLPLSRSVPRPGHLPRAIDRGLTPLLPFIPPLLGQAPGGTSQVVLGVGIRGAALLSPLRPLAQSAPVGGPAPKDSKDIKDKGEVPLPSSDFDKDPRLGGHSFDPVERGICAAQGGHEGHEGREGHRGHHDHEASGARKGVSDRGSHGEGGECDQTGRRPGRRARLVQESREARPSSVASRTRSSGGTGSLKRKP